jgi:catechol 2,3-dioxygenase-like lactoylglutathione lyase family enzyme
MIGYVTLGTSDMERAKQFYTSLLAPLGASVLMDSGRMAAIGNEPGQAMLALCTPWDEGAPTPGNGTMVAIPSASVAMVRELHQRALELGGSDEGPPGERGEGVFGAYVRDPDGNKLCLYHLNGGLSHGG